MMAERLVVLIENDPVLSERLRAVLAAYHLRVELVADGNELALRADLDPSLIILSIDPKRLGWAVCNKLKKAPQFRGVPLIVTSQEATDKDFEDHKKLRTRAEEYLHKPFSVELLLEKISSLIGLDPPQMEEPGIEEIPIDDAALIEDIRAKTNSIYHPSCSCRMGTDPMSSVVDPKLKVHGVSGLRIIDASVFPTVTSGNLNGPSLMVGEKGADLVVADTRG